MIDYLDWGRESELCFCYRLLVIMWVCSEGFPLPLCAWERLRYFIVAQPWPSVESLFEIFARRTSHFKMKSLGSFIESKIYLTDFYLLIA